MKKYLAVQDLSDSGIFCWEKSRPWQPTVDHLETESWVAAYNIHGYFFPHIRLLRLTLATPDMKFANAIYIYI